VAEGSFLKMRCRMGEQHERRRLPRTLLPWQIRARVRGVKEVRLLDLSVGGTRLEHLGLLRRGRTARSNSPCCSVASACPLASLGPLSSGGAERGGGKTMCGQVTGGIKLSKVGNPATIQCRFGRLRAQNPYETTSFRMEGWWKSKLHRKEMDVHR